MNKQKQTLNLRYGTLNGLWILQPSQHTEINSALCVVPHLEIHHHLLAKKEEVVLVSVSVAVIKHFDRKQLKDEGLIWVIG